VRDDVEGLIKLLEIYQRDHGATQFYGTRTLFNENVLTPLQRAAAFIYLNKTCFNGLWRVNKAGAFNVPMGKYKNPAICNASALRAAAAALVRAEFRSGDFALAVRDAVAGDFVYFDPPYHETFTAYTGDSFNEIQQRRLARLARELADKGVHVLLSNSDTPLIREIYDGIRIDEVQCGRAINANGAGRASVTELLISSASGASGARGASGASGAMQIPGCA